MRAWAEDPDAPRHYFAYGSNMCSQRLLARVPSARVLGRAVCAGYRLVCNKPSRDGSGKANLVEARGTAAWGVLYRIDLEHWETLDVFEPDYTRHVCSVRLDDGAQVTAGVYTWLGEAPARAAYDWYREHLLRGAREHGLPRDAIEEIRAWATLRDPKRRG